MHPFRRNRKTFFCTLSIEAKRFSCTTFGEADENISPLLCEVTFVLQDVRRIRIDVFRTIPGRAEQQILHDSRRSRRKTLPYIMRNLTLFCYTFDEAEQISRTILDGAKEKICAIFGSV